MYYKGLLITPGVLNTLVSRKRWNAEVRLKNMFSGPGVSFWCPPVREAAPTEPYFSSSPPSPSNYVSTSHDQLRAAKTRGKVAALCAWKPGETGNKRILTRTKKNNNNKAPLLLKWLNDPRPVVLDYTTSTFNSFVPLKADATFCLTDSVSHPSHFQSQCCRKVFSGEFWPTRHKCFYARSWSPCTLARHIPSTYRGYVCNILHPAHVGVIN